MGAVRRILLETWHVGNPDTRAGADLLAQRYHSLQRQIPLLYLSILACFVGVHLSTSGELAHVASPVTGVVLLVVFRLVYWVRTSERTLGPEQIQTELRTTLCFAVIFSVFFCVWALILFSQPDTPRHFIILFGALASMGCAYGLSSFPKAARIPLFLLGMPLALTSMLTGEANYIGVGIALALIVLLVSRVLSVHNRSLEDLTESRSETEVERERAQSAEQVALAERAKASEQADTDHLTGLANRRAFMRELERRLAEPSEHGGALGIVDLDGFKPINDAFGHATGDAVLKFVAGRLKTVLQSPSFCARVGGDEFAFLLPEHTTERAAKAVGIELCRALEKPICVDGREFRVAGCCGLAMLDVGEQDASQALLRADTALYSAKARGKASARLFSTSMERQRQRRLKIEQELRQPHAQSEIYLVYQPIFDLRTGQVRSYEALARWKHGELGEVPPSEFILIAEQIGVIESISAKLLRRAIQEAMSWNDGVKLSFNLSAAELTSTTLAHRILSELRRQGLDPGRLQVEVTETVLLVDFETARANLAKLQSHGVGIVLDDFGAGYASISYLQELQFDCVKLDGGLLVRAAKSPRSLKLLHGVLDLCRSLGVTCVAEHVESLDQLEILLGSTCEKGQGYLLSKPLSAIAAQSTTPSQVLQDRNLAEYQPRAA